VDWKDFYRDELAAPAGRAAVDSAIARHAAGDAEVIDALRSRGVVSFPHVTLRDSADPIAHVVQSILAVGARRVVALGVLHGGTLQVPLRGDLAEFHRGSPRAAEIFRRLGGAFVDRGPATTPWGDVPDGPLPATSDVVRENSAALANEFSLDLFLALLAAAARGRGVAPPAVTRVFVSVTRDPSGSFAAATAVADAVRPLLDDDAVCVATGDLVHYGNSYTPPAEMESLPLDAASLVTKVRPRIDAMHEAALARRDFAAAYATASEIRSDQRNVLPVIAELLGRGARATVLSFGLANYAAINGVAPPCFVASALVAFRPGA
jgi:hypothetical protein